MNAFYIHNIKIFPNIDIFKKPFSSPFDPQSVINNDFTNYSFITNLCFNKDSKINILYSNIVSNFFLQPEKKETILDIFCKAQKCYYGFTKLAYLYKYNKAKLCNVDRDLFMNSFSSLKDNILITSFDIKSNIIYKFRISDIISIIINSYHMLQTF